MARSTARVRCRCRADCAQRSDGWSPVSFERSAQSNLASLDLGIGGDLRLTLELPSVKNCGWPCRLTSAWRRTVARRMAVVMALTMRGERVHAAALLQAVFSHRTCPRPPWLHSGLHVFTDRALLRPRVAQALGPKARIAADRTGRPGQPRSSWALQQRNGCGPAASSDLTGCPGVGCSSCMLRGVCRCWMPDVERALLRLCSKLGSCSMTRAPAQMTASVSWVGGVLSCNASSSTLAPGIAALPRPGRSR